MTDSATVAGDV